MQGKDKAGTLYLKLLLVIAQAANLKSVKVVGKSIFKEQVMVITYLMMQSVFLQNSLGASTLLDLPISMSVKTSLMITVIANL